MAIPTQFQLPLADRKLEIDGLYSASKIAESVSGGGNLPEGIVASNRGGGLNAYRIGAQPTTGSPLSQAALDLDAPSDRLTVVFEVYLDYDQPGATEDFINWARILAEGGTTICELGQLDGPVSSTKTILTGEAAWSNGVWASNHVQVRTPTRIKIDVKRSTGAAGANADGVIAVYVKTGASWTLVSVRAHDRGRPQRIRFLNRPLNEIQLLVPEVEFRLLAVSQEFGLDAAGDSAASAFDFSDLQQCAQLRGCVNSATSGKWDQGVFVSYDPRVYGTPSGAIQAEVQASTDPNFSSGVIHASIALVDVDTYTGATLTDNVDFGGVARLKGLDPLATYHWRVRLVDGGAISDPDAAITGGTQVLLTDSASFATMSAPGGAAGTLKLMHGTCQRHDDLSTPHNHWLRGLEFGPHLVLVPDDHYYADLTFNAIPVAHTLTAGATRKDGYLLHARGSVFLPQPWTRLATTSAITGTRGNHAVDSQFPGNATPTEQALVDDALPAFNRYWEDGALLTDRPEGDWGFIDTAQMRLFIVNATTYDNDGGAHGPEGRALQAATPRLLGATQMQALLDAIEQCEAPMFLIDGMPSFANDAESPSSVGVSWALAPDQRSAVLDAIEANPNIRLFMTFCGHWHFACVTRQGLPTDGKHLADVIAAPLARPIGSNFDTAFLAGYDGGPIFKSANGATVGGTDPTSMFALIEVDESALSVRVRIQNDDGVDLHDQTFAASAAGAAGARSRAAMGALALGLSFD